MRYLVIGLGNIGEMYADTRHNIGFQVIDHIAKEHQARFSVKPLGALATIVYKNLDVCLLKPSTYMNDSGKAVKYWLSYYKLPLERVLIVVDDLHLPFGHFRFKAEGSHGGHNGLKSISQALQTSHYHRLRVGIGDDFSPGRQADFVLGRFTSKEKKTLPTYIEEASKRVYAFCELGIVKAMCLYNKKG